MQVDLVGFTVVVTILLGGSLSVEGAVLVALADEVVEVVELVDEVVA